MFRNSESDNNGKPSKEEPKKENKGSIEKISKSPEKPDPKATDKKAGKTDNIKE